jgi:hypothetical protein
MTAESGPLTSVRNDRIQFITIRLPGAVLPTLERRVVVTGPPELVRLVQGGSTRTLDELVALLPTRDRAWAAGVMLSAMTGREGDLVNAFAARPQEWWPSVGEMAHERWSRWLAGAKPRLTWDSENSVFVEGW